jgi:hypothetical protein
MNTLAKTLAAAALIAVSTFTMAAGKPVGDNSKKATVNLSTSDLAIDHYVAVMTEGQSAGVEQLFTSDFSQKVRASNDQTNSRSEVISFLKIIFTEPYIQLMAKFRIQIGVTDYDTGPICTHIKGQDLRY